jgi:hypothetical protein
MKFYNPILEEYITLEELKSKFNGTSFPKNINPDFEFEGYYCVSESEVPEYDEETQKIIEDIPTYNDVDSKWYKSFQVIDLTPEELSQKEQEIINRINRDADDAENR